MNVRSRHKSPRNSHDPERNAEIDLALAVMCALQRPGECVPSRAIAAVTGMSHGGSFAIEQRALRKLRLRLRYTTERALGHECAA